MAAVAEATPEPGDVDEASDFQGFRCRVEALLGLCANLQDFSGQSSEESKKCLEECITELKRRNEDIESESFVQYLSDIEDIGAYLDNKREELEKVRIENLSLSDEVGHLTKDFDEDFLQFQNELAHFGSLLEDRDSSEASEMSSSNLRERLSKQDSLSMQEKCHFEVLALEGLIEKRKAELDCIEDLKSMLKRVEAICQVEEVLCHAKVIEFKDNCIRLSLKTFLPMAGSLKYQLSFEKMIGPSAIHHEMLIKVIPGTRELVDVEIFPNDVPIGDIVNDVKSARKNTYLSVAGCRRTPLDVAVDRRRSSPSPAIAELCSAAAEVVEGKRRSKVEVKHSICELNLSRTDVSCPLSFLKIRSPLEWMVRKVQQRILICNLRRLILKDANRSRHKFEYSVDGAITAYLAGGIQASIMVPESWPMSDSALRLLSLKNLNVHSKDVSVGSLHKLEELANSLDSERRYNLLNFVEAIEQILKEQLSLDNL
ncbi:hypothetical protein EJ110_NYTH08231 [Nymphaea thermarum]|nr:hypothetical protein EJ110_NYTH08231 [Nymphaea thermarum]